MLQALLDGAAPFHAAGDGRGGVLLLHGLTGSPHSLRALAGRLAEAGFAVELPLLPGHGSAPSELVSLGYEDFASAASAALVELSARCERVVVAGLSMGGTIACQLAEREADLAGLVLVNPLVCPPARSMLELLRAGLAGGTTTMPPIASDLKASDVREVGYDALPLAPLLSLLEATGPVARDLEQIRCPVLLFSSRTDHVVPPESGDLVADRLGENLERVMLENSYHVATLDHDAPAIERRVSAFCQKVCQR